MIELKVVNSKNEVVGKEKVDESIFKASFRPYLMHDYVVMQRRKLRQGTHSTKTRAEVSGTGKKPFRQKGTGQARQGTLIGPHQVGGGIAFGPKPRCYSTALNKKTKDEAIRVALSQKNFENKLFILDTIDVASGKTKDAVKLVSVFLKPSALVVGDFSEPTTRAFRNLPRAKAISTKALNVADILRFDHLLIDRKSLGWISERYQKPSKKVEKGAA